MTAQMNSLADVRSAIDKIDREVVRLIGERAGYVRNAARFKKNADEVAAKERFTAMLATRRDWALTEGVDPDMVEQLYRTMIEHFIREEMQQCQTDAVAQESAPCR